MKKKLCVVAMVAGLVLWGCGRDEQTAEGPPPETAPAAEQPMDKTAEEAEAMGEVREEAEVAGEERAQEAAAPVQEKMAAVPEKAAPVAAKAAAVPAKAEKLTTALESVTLDNSYGKVVLNHKKHAEAFGCAACHGEQKPGPLTLGKDAAHALCQGCHKQKAGPTSCTQCHQKKAAAGY